MTVALYTFIDLFDRALATAAHLIDKATEHASAKGIGEQDVLKWQLIDDMQPLNFQLMVVINFSQQWPARVANLPVPAGVTVELDMAGFRAGISHARQFLSTLTPEQFEGRDEATLTVQITEGMIPTLSGNTWLAVFATTNIFFHLSTAYGILRSHGVPLGKPDMFARGL